MSIQIRITEFAASGGVDRLLGADQRRWAILACVILGGNCFLSPIETLPVPGGAIYIDNGVPFRISFDKFGQLLTNEWYISGNVGSVGTITEILI